MDAVEVTVVTVVTVVVGLTRQAPSLYSVRRAQAGNKQHRRGVALLMICSTALL